MNVSETSKGYEIALAGLHELRTLENVPLTAPFGQREFELAYNACGKQSVLGSNNEQVYVSIHHEVFRDLIGSGKCKIGLPVRGEPHVVKSLEIVVQNGHKAEEPADTLEDEDVDEGKED